MIDSVKVSVILKIGSYNIFRRKGKMKNKVTKVITALGLTAFLALGSILPGSTLQAQAASDNGVEAFVSRMYTVALGREAEDAGLKDWSSQLENKTNDGAGIAHGFIMSDEFKKKGLNNSDYVTTLYRTFFDREPDEGGYNDWMGKLNAGTGRGEVLAGFTNSEEFSNLCGKFGILRGYMYANGDAANAGIGQFVSRLYSKALGRAGEAAGINDWTTQIATKAKTAEEVATDGFFNSDEFKQKNMTNSEFLDILYATFFDRAADEGGKTEWLNKMQNGTSKSDVILGFSRSEEFNNLLAKYGLTGGNNGGTNDSATNDGVVYTLKKGIPTYSTMTVEGLGTVPAVAYRPYEADYDICVTSNSNGTVTDSRDSYGVTYREYCEGANASIKTAVDAYFKTHPNGKVAANSNRIMIITSSTTTWYSDEDGFYLWMWQYFESQQGKNMICLFMANEEMDVNQEVAEALDKIEQYAVFQ